MTLVRLPKPPSVMPLLEVDPGDIEACGTQLRAVCARLDDLGSFAAGPARLDEWSGLAARSYRSATSSIGRGADAMSLALRRVAGRVLHHSDVLTRLAQRHDDLVRTSTSLAGGIEVLRHDIAAATSDGIVLLAPVLQARSEAIAAHVTTYEAEREVWVVDLAVEEREMTTAFERLLTLESVERRFGGTPDPADEALVTLPHPGASPEAVRDWWRSLPRAQRDGLLVAAPGLVGGLAGIPAVVRHRANTVRLERDLARLRSLRDRGLLTDHERLLLRNAEAARGATDRAGRLVDPRTGDAVPARLYLYEPSAFGGDGAVVVAIGDPGVADDVSVLVPGMSTDGAGISSLTDSAIAVYEAARAADGSASHASLAWIGYDAPDDVPLVDGFPGDVGGVLGEGMAERGGERLSDAVEGLRAERHGPPADLTVIGHSYGSTTAGHAAHDHGLDVDDLVVVGSPGLGGSVDHVDDLGVDPGRVWVGANSQDAVTDFAGHGWVGPELLLGAGLGDDPAADDFGATRFQAESTTRGSFVNLADHDKYFDRDTESLHNIAQVVTGNHDRVEQADPVTDPWWRPPSDPEGGRSPTAPITTYR